MKDRTAVRSRGFLVGLAMVAALAPAVPALAHCDTVDGPVVGAARQALARGDVTPVLKWVGPEHEAEVAAAFAHVLAVRPLGDDARELADRFFFETLVRLHREGEGVSYVGLKEAGSPVSPAVLAADLALESGSVDDLTAEITGAIDAGVQKRFRRAREMRMHAEESVAAGREFVAAYVGFTHYVEALEALAAGHPVEHGTAAGASPKGMHGGSHELEEPLSPSTVFELPQEVGYGPGKEVSVLLDESHLKLAALTLRQGTALPPHSAPVPTTIQVLEGEGIIHIDSEQIPVTKGSLVSLRAGAAHDVLPKQGSDMLLLVHYLRSGGPLATHSAKEH
jgi:quercetin dioxygenase-like cupin family protein